MKQRFIAKLAVADMVKNFSVFYMTLVLTVHDRQQLDQVLSQMNSVQGLHIHFIFKISFHQHLGPPRVYFLRKLCIHF